MSAGGRTDGLTDMTKLIIAFRNFANAPKTWSASVTRQACGETLQLASYRDLVYSLEGIPDVTCTAEPCGSNLALRRDLPFILLVIFNVSPK